MSQPVGIDLGTTYSAIATVNKYQKPEVLRNNEGSLLAPSVVAVRETPPLVGAPAKELLQFGEAGVAAFFKRAMGDRSWQLEGIDSTYTPTDLSALILAKLKRDAEAAVGEMVSDAVITVPAYFNNDQREATQQAGTKAGLNVLMTINEPTAAAVAYGIGNQHRSGRILVFDLGGGTFDVTLLDITDDEMIVLATDGDHELGGKDWDDRLANHVAALFYDEHGSQPLEEPDSYYDMITASEQAKQSLSAAEKTRLRVSHDGHRAAYEITRSDFDRLTNDLMERTTSLCETVLDDQGLNWNDLEGVLLVGGSTRMPMVQAELMKRSGKAPLMGVDVDEAVALGAAIQANELVAKKTGKLNLRLPGARHFKDVTSHSLGMVSLAEDRKSYTNSIILPKNRQIPSEDTRPFVLRTSANEENKLEVYLTQGEESDLSKCAFIGRYVAENLKHRDVETVLDVTYAYDESGIVQVSATDKASGMDLSLRKEQIPDDMAWVYEPPQVSNAVKHITAYLAVDLSGSMSGQPLAEAQAAAREFAKHLDFSRSSLGLVTFADRARTNIKATRNAKELERAIGNMNIGDEVGYGNLKSPFAHTHRLLKDPTSARFIILLTDGAWVHQKKAIREAKACHQDNVQVIAIGFGGADKKFLNEVATSEAESFFANAGQLVETFGSIAQQITTGAGQLRRVSR